MEHLLTSLNESLDIEAFNYKTFSQSHVFMSVGMKHLQDKYINKAIVYITYAVCNGEFHFNLIEAIQLFSLSNKLYMVIPLNINFGPSGHANVLFFYKEKGKIYCERYDPEYSCCITAKYHRKVDLFLYKELTMLNIKYISPEMMSVIVCPQAYIVDNFGYCQTYTLIYIDNLLSMPKRNRLETMAMFPTKNQLNNYIKDIVMMILTFPRLTKKDKEYILNFDNLSQILKVYVSALIMSRTLEVTSSNV